MAIARGEAAHGHWIAMGEGEIFKGYLKGAENIPFYQAAWLTEPPDDGTDVSVALFRIAAEMFEKGAWYFEAVIFCSYWAERHYGAASGMAPAIFDAVRGAYDADRAARPHDHARGEAGRPGIAAGYAGLLDAWPDFPDLCDRNVPALLRTYVFDMARIKQANPILCLDPMLSAVSAAVLDRVSFKDAKEDWQEPLTLWFLTGAGPTAGKTICAKEFFRPLQEYDAAVNKGYA
jgi:hypothetical protein